MENKNQNTDLKVGDENPANRTLNKYHMEVRAERISIPLDGDGFEVVYENGKTLHFAMSYMDRTEDDFDEEDN